MVEVVKSYEMVLTFNNFKASFSYVCGEKIRSIADIGRKILNMVILVLKIFLTILVRKIFLTSPLPPPPRQQHFREKFLRLGQNPRKSWSKHDEPPTLPTLMASRRSCCNLPLAISIHKTHARMGLLLLGGGTVWFAPNKQTKH